MSTGPARDRRRASARNREGGFTLMETLIAVGILFTVVMAVTSAVVAAQQNAFEARQRIAATLAAEDLMGRIVIEEYDDLMAWHGFTEPVGTMTDISGAPYPPSFDTVGRNVTVSSSLKTMVGLGVAVGGRMVRVRTFDGTGRTLADLTQFIPEPAP